ncbi:hypothetical protein Tco_0429766 [Tanacetum coccineum]
MVLIWLQLRKMVGTSQGKYPELTPADAIQADCDVKATNIILHGLPLEVYALVSNHRIAKELCERIQHLMQGTSITPRVLVNVSTVIHGTFLPENAEHQEMVLFRLSDMAEDEIQTNMALMAFTDSEVSNDKSCSKSCLQNYEALKKQYDDLLVKLDDTPRPTTLLKHYI